MKLLTCSIHIGNAPISKVQLDEFSLTEHTRVNSTSVKKQNVTRTPTLFLWTLSAPQPLPSSLGKGRSVLPESMFHSLHEWSHTGIHSPMPCFFHSTWYLQDLLRLCKELYIIHSPCCLDSLVAILAMSPRGIFLRIITVVPPLSVMSPILLPFFFSIPPIAI